MGMNPKKLVRKVLPKQGIKAAEEAYRKGRIYAIQARQGFPAKNLRVIAVTGTNGKTTTTNYINAMLKSAGYRTALFSTAVIEMNGVSRLNRTHRTVPLTAELIGFFKQAKAAKVDFVVMEVTSMALDQHKMIGMPVEIAVMTNLTQDHLDYHKTMEAYAEAKARLFNSYMKPKHIVLNRDDSWFDYFKSQSISDVTTYGEAADSDVRIDNIQLAATQSTWTLAGKLLSAKFKTSLPGKFNVMNATAAASVGALLGITADQLEQGIAKLDAVPGRMEVIDAGQLFGVLVDYAHTPDALENVLQAAHGIAKKRVILVFGATGDRDAAKRPIMGEVTAHNADLIYLTDDETYTEDPVAIRDAVRAGLESAKANFIEVAERKDAIKAAFKEAKAGDVVILTGMGHQDTRNMGGKSIAWDEREVARELLK
jgi:UDP-N-acetylmuramoyl-L-alanyl-D-glutamate--2,6-diaminopimelate ligase